MPVHVSTADGYLTGSPGSSGPFIIGRASGTHTVDDVVFDSPGGRRSYRVIDESWKSLFRAVGQMQSFVSGWIVASSNGNGCHVFRRSSDSWETFSGTATNVPGVYAGTSYAWCLTDDQVSAYLYSASYDDLMTWTSGTTPIFTQIEAGQGFWNYGAAQSGSRAVTVLEFGFDGGQSYLGVAAVSDDDGQTWTTATLWLGSGTYEDYWWIQNGINAYDYGFIAACEKDDGSTFVVSSSDGLTWTSGAYFDPNAEYIQYNGFYASGSHISFVVYPNLGQTPAHVFASHDGGQTYTSQSFDGAIWLNQTMVATYANDDYVVFVLTWNYPFRHETWVLQNGQLWMADAGSLSYTGNPREYGNNIKIHPFGERAMMTAVTWDASVKKASHRSYVLGDDFTWSSQQTQVTEAAAVTSSLVSTRRHTRVLRSGSLPLDFVYTVNSTPQLTVASGSDIKLFRYLNNTLHILSSTDGGSSWSPDTVDIDGYLPGYGNFYSGSVICFGGTAGGGNIRTVVSTDFGQTWVTGTIVAHNQFGSIVVSGSSVLVFCSALSSHDCYISSDFGASWSFLSHIGDDGNPYIHSLLSGNTIFAFDTYARHVTSSDGGATWSQPRSVPSDAQPMYAQTYDAIVDKDGFIVLSCVGAYSTVFVISDDGGETWSICDNAVLGTDNPSYRNKLKEHKGRLYYSINAPSSNPDIDTASGTIAYSSDHGMTWTAETFTPDNFVVHGHALSEDANFESYAFIYGYNPSHNHRAVAPFVILRVLDQDHEIRIESSVGDGAMIQTSGALYIEASSTLIRNGAKFGRKPTGYLALGDTIDVFRVQYEDRGFYPEYGNVHTTDVALYATGSGQQMARMDLQTHVSGNDHIVYSEIKLSASRAGVGDERHIGIRVDSVSRSSSIEWEGGPLVLKGTSVNEGDNFLVVSGVAGDAAFNCQRSGRDVLLEMRPGDIGSGSQISCKSSPGRYAKADMAAISLENEWAYVDLYGQHNDTGTSTELSLGAALDRDWNDAPNNMLSSYAQSFQITSWDQNGNGPAPMELSASSFAFYGGALTASTIVAPDGSIQISSSQVQITGTTDISGALITNNVLRSTAADSNGYNLLLEDPVDNLVSINAGVYQSGCYIGAYCASDWIQIYGDRGHPCFDVRIGNSGTSRQFFVELDDSRPHLGGIIRWTNLNFGFVNSANKEMVIFGATSSFNTDVNVSGALTASTIVLSSVLNLADYANPSPADGDVWRSGSDILVRITGSTYRMQLAAYP